MAVSSSISTTHTSDYRLVNNKYFNSYLFILTELLLKIDIVVLLNTYLVEFENI